MSLFIVQLGPKPKIILNKIKFYKTKVFKLNTIASRFKWLLNQVMVLMYNVIIFHNLNNGRIQYLRSNAIIGWPGPFFKDMFLIFVMIVVSYPNIIYNQCDLGLKLRHRLLMTWLKPQCASFDYLWHQSAHRVISKKHCFWDIVLVCPSYPEQSMSGWLYLLSLLMQHLPSVYSVYTPEYQYCIVT